MQFFLYLFIALLLLGNLVVLLIFQEKSPILDFLIKHNWYFPYHVVLTLYLLPLGEFGRELREKSFMNFCHVIGPILMKEINPHKPELFAGLKAAGESGKSGKPLTVLEIGIGPCTNFPYYPGKCELVVVEPESFFRKEVEQKLKSYPGIHLKGFYDIGAEDMTSVIDSGTIDAVIGTLVLCSVNNNDSVLREVLRVLKPGGKYYFYEHVKSKPSWKRKIQEFLHWSTIWRYWMCGCDFYDTHKLIKKTGFSTVECKEAYLSYSKFSLPLEFINHNYYGIATK